MAPGGKIDRESVVLPARDICVLPVGGVNVTFTLVASELPTLQTLAPVLKVSGPSVTLLLSSPTNGLGFRAIERVKGVHHTTVITWVRQVGELLPDAYAPETIPEIGELDELETFVGSKKQNLAVERG